MRVEEFKNVCRPHVHPTQKPVDLLRYLIRTYTNPGEVVLDFTMGSGTTCVAAVLEGRKFIGIEKDPAYFDIAVKRIGDTEENE
jgi:DNA modification methylase